LTLRAFSEPVAPLSASRRYNRGAMPIELVIVSTLAALLQVAALMLVIRGLIWLIGGKARTSFVYGIFTVGSMPFIRLTRRIAPRAVPDAYIPVIAFVLVCVVCIALLFIQQALCARPGAQCA
jgi:hypothetical protein